MRDLVSVSRFLSLVLRHRPELIDLQLDEAGWADIDDLIRQARDHHALDRAIIERVVADNAKQRFAISDDGGRIRASQGHSIDVDLGLAPVPPPDLLYHGTATRFVDAIRNEGLLKRDRRHVHLSADIATATNVGARHGKPVVLTIHAGRMAATGHAVFRSANGVWLTDAVPPAFIDFPE